jgi:putative hemolysin
MLLEILIVTILLMLNAFFALSEFAIVSSSKYKLKHLLKTGDKRAKIALKLVAEPGKFLSTIQIGITLVGILAGAYGGATIAEKIEPYFNNISWINPYGEIASVTIVVMIITYFSVVVGELLPKQIALSNPEKLAVKVAPTMSLVSEIFSPLVKLLEKSSEILMTIFGIIRRSEKKITEAEVKAIIDEGVESGAIEHEEKDMMQRIIKLGDRSIKSIMSHRTEITFFDKKDNPESIRQKLRNSRHARYPVLSTNGQDIDGVIEVKDILEAALSGKLSDINSFIKRPTILPESANCLQALKIFKTSPTHLITVIDEYGNTQGIVTLSDILEAIVGTISSNYSLEKKPHITRREADCWLVDGITSIDEVNLEIGTELTDNKNYETIAGFVQKGLSGDVKEGDILNLQDYSFEIIDMDGYQIDKIMIKKKSANDYSEPMI